MRQMSFVANMQPDAKDFSVLVGQIASIRTLYDAIKEKGLPASRRPKKFITIMRSVNQYVDMIILGAYSKDALEKCWLEPLIIGKSARPRCIIEGDVECKYYSSPSAWMTTTSLFNRYLLELNVKMLCEF